MKKNILLSLTLCFCMPYAWADNITFADENAKAICVTNWDTNNDGELSYDEAAAVTDIGIVFMKSNIITFDELQFFTSITEIPVAAFQECSITSVVIPNHVTTIGHHAFCYSGLSSIEIPEGVTTIGECAFLYCWGLKSITIPNSVTEIGSTSFHETGLTSIFIPHAVDSIGYRAFTGCPYLESIIVEEGNAKFDSRNGCNAIIETASNTLIAGCKNTIIPEGVLAIGGCAFEQLNDELTTITIPGTVKFIGEYAFSATTGLSSIVIPEGVEEIGSFCFYGCSDLQSISLPQTLVKLGEGAFRDNGKLKTIVIPKNVEEINHSFWNCDNLESIIVEDGSLYYESPNNRCLVESASKMLVFSLDPFIPEGVEIIGAEPFMSVKEKPLTIIIPSSVKRIGYRAFGGLDLTSLELPEGIEILDVESLGFLLLDSSHLTIPSTVTSIGARLLWGSTISTLSVAEGNPIYDSRDNCNAIIETASNTLIESSKSTIIPNSVTSIGDYAFHGVKGSSFIIPEGVIRIGAYAFYESELSSVTIPPTVTEIGSAAFLGWNESFPATVKVGMRNPVEIDEQTFPHRSNAMLFVPIGSKAAYEAADYWKEFKKIGEYRETDQTANTLSATVPQSMLTGKDASISLNLTNEDQIIMTEFYLKLPEGISIANDEDGYPDVTINSQRNNKHSVEVVLGNDGFYHFMCYSAKNNALKGNDGELFHLNLVVDENMAPGTYQAVIQNILMVNVDRKNLTQIDYTFDIVVMNVEMGDANGDGRINGLDVVDIVDYILGRPSEYFVFAASDLTGDGKVDGMDLVNMVSLVMSQNYQKAPSAKHVPSIGHVSDEPEILLQKLSSTELQLGVSSSDEFILTQFVVTLSDDALLLDIETDNSHVASWRLLGNGRYAVIVYSVRNKSFSSNGMLARLSVSEDCAIDVTDMMAVDVDRHEHWLANVSNDVTSILLQNKQNNSYSISYDLQGRRNSSLSAKGLYIINGKKMIKK